MPPLTVLHSDEQLLACAKPPGLLTVPVPRKNRGHGVPADTLVARLRREGHGELLPVHRLDREASGVVLFARSPEVRDGLVECFRRREVEKTYVAVVQGYIRPAEGVLRFPIQDLGASARIAPHGQLAETRYRVKERLGHASVLEVELMTGRHNQIRLHFAHVGHPLVGERKYARGRDARVRHKRAALHAWRIAVLPPSGVRLELEAPLPQDLENLIGKLRGELPGS